MNNALVTLQQNALSLPDDENTLALAKSLGGGLTGGGFGNRISLKGNRFRFIISGTDVGAHRENHLDVVLLAANPHVSRIFYAKQYDPNSKEAPDCYSLDGKSPPLDVPNRQSDKCMTCPQNVKGSALRGDSKAKACSYKKRVIIVSPDSIDGDMYALDVNALSLFGTDQSSQNLYNLKSYIETLTAHSMMAVKLVTRLTFDENSSVPKLFFSPIRILSVDEWAAVKERMNEDAIQTMLGDVINEAETGELKPEAVRAQPAPAAPQRPAAAPVAPTPPAPAAAAPAAPQMPPLPRPRGRPAKEAAPAAPPAAPAPNGNGNAGFTAQIAQPATPAPTEGTPKAKGFTIDLDEFDA